MLCEIVGLCGVFLYGFRRLYLSKADSITDTCMDFDIKSRQFCFLLKIQKNYDCFFILYSLLNRFQRCGPLEDIAQRNFICFTWNDKFKLIILYCVLLIRRMEFSWKITDAFSCLILCVRMI